MGVAFARFIPIAAGRVGVLGIGGGGGTSIVRRYARIARMGCRSFSFSTLASGDTAPYIGISDLILMPAVTDTCRAEPDQPG